MEPEAAAPELRYRWDWSDPPGAPESMSGYTARRLSRDDVSAFAEEQLATHSGELVRSSDDQRDAVLANFRFDFGTIKLVYSANVYRSLVYSQFRTACMHEILGPAPLTEISFEPDTAIFKELSRMPPDMSLWTDEVARIYDDQSHLLEREMLTLALAYSKKTGAIFMDLRGYGLYREEELQHMVDQGLQRYETWAWTVGMGMGAALALGEAAIKEIRLANARDEMAKNAVKPAGMSPFWWPFGKKRSE